MKRGTPEHPKTLDLMGRLSCSRVVAVGILELLWHFTARYAPQGNVGKWADEAIAKAIGWDGDGAAMVAALVGAGWLDRDPEYRLLIHDWHQHADEATKKALARAHLPILSRQYRDAVSTQSGQETAPKEPTSRPPEPEPEPEPVPRLSRAREAELPEYLEALRRLHPAFADELAVGRALFESRQLLPPLAEFEATLAAWASSPQWTDEGGRYAPKPARWIRDGGYRSGPPIRLASARRRGGAAIEAHTEGDLDSGTRVVEVGSC